MEEETSVDLPPGFRFKPSDQELILILRRIILGLPLSPNNPITQRDVYGGDEANPWLVFPDDDPYWVTLTGDDGKKKLIYAFTHLKNASSNSKTRASRTAGCGGTWHGDRGRRNIYDQKSQLIGYWKTYHYRVTKKANMINMGMVGHWIMHEFTLAGISLNGLPSSLDHENYVLCKISKDVKKPLKIIEIVEEVPCHDQIAMTSAEGGKRKQYSPCINLPDEESQQAKKFCTGESSPRVEIDREASSELASKSAAADFDWDLEEQLQQVLYYSFDDHVCSAAQMVQNQSPTAPSPMQSQQPSGNVGTNSGVANEVTSNWALVDLLTPQPISQIPGADNNTIYPEYGRLPFMSDVQPPALIQSEVQQAYNGLFDRSVDNQNQLPPYFLHAEAEIPQRQELCCAGNGVAKEAFDWGLESEDRFLNLVGIDDISHDADSDPFAEDENIKGDANFKPFDDGLRAFAVQLPQFSSITIR